MKTLITERYSPHEYRVYDIVNIEGNYSPFVKVFPVLESFPGDRATFVVHVIFSRIGQTCKGILMFEGDSIHNATWAKGEVYWDSCVEPEMRYITFFCLMEADDLVDFLYYFNKAVCERNGAVLLKPIIENRTFTTLEFADFTGKSSNIQE